MVAVETFFLDAPVGQRFCVLHAPAVGQPVLGGLVYIHPLAEEMNHSRRMAALQARAFATAGYAVLQIDLLGCGDSSGDFGDANWAAWLDDVRLAHQWLTSRFACPVWLWGLRMGCLLAVEVVCGLASKPSNLLLWQPVLSGRKHLTQFLRLKFAGDLVRGNRGEGAEALLLQVMSGKIVEVAGYRLSADLAHGLERSNLAQFNPLSRLVCFEVFASPGANLSPAFVSQITRWHSAQVKASAQCVQGPAFWQTQEAGVCPELITASLAAVTEATKPPEQVRGMF